MTYFTDHELDAATEAVLANVLAPLDLPALTRMVVYDSLKGFVRRQCANCLTAAAKARGVS